MRKSRLFLMLLLLTLAALLLTGCLGQWMDKASIKALMSKLDDHDFDFLGKWNREPENVDFEDFMGDLDVALGYFADPISVAVASSGNNPGRDWSLSEEFDHAMLLQYELEWDLNDYRDHIWQSLGLEAEDTFVFLLTFMDLNFDPILYLAYNKEDYDPVRITGPVVSVVGNTATWTKGYAVQGIVLADTTRWKKEVSVDLEIDLKKGADSKWKISHVNFAWHTKDERIDN
ncbi:MAG: hypothetical protein GX249_06230 [Firmicutes bacterium]|nr:hypothetical protein [Bacillota bacterium]